jgi:hypothetical protein
MSDLPYSELLAARLRIAEIAAAVLDRRVGIIEGSRQLMEFRLDVDPDQEDSDLLGMCGIESQTDHLPLGAVRQYWDAEALRLKDAELADHESFFQHSAFEMCRSLVERYSRPA